MKDDRKRPPAWPITVKLPFRAGMVFRLLSSACTLGVADVMYVRGDAADTPL